MTSTTDSPHTSTHPHELTRIGDKEVFVETTGEGPDVVMIHGLGGATPFYDPLVNELAKDFRFTRYDFNGHGRTPLSGEVNITSLTAELAAVIETQTAFGKAHLVGHSMGTLVVQHLAASRPELVDSITLLGPVRAQPEKAKAGTRDRAALVRDQGMSAVADSISRGATSDQAAKHNSLIRPFVRELLLRQNTEGYAQACEALAEAVNPDLSKITAKTLLITGDEDGVSPPATSEAMETEIAHVERHTITGIGHWTVLEAPDFVADFVGEFIGTVLKED